VLREGETRHPPVAVPIALRRVLRFRKLSHAALEAIASALDADDALRRRVRDAVDEETVGRVGWLWVDRPEGWRDTLCHEVESARDAKRDTNESNDRAVRRKLEGAERAASRNAELVERLEGELRRAHDELAALRDDRAALTRRCDELDAAVRELREQRNAAVASLKRAEDVLSRRTDERRVLEERLVALTGSADRLPVRTDGPTNDDDARVDRVDRVDLGPLLDRLDDAMVVLGEGLRELHDAVGDDARAGGRDRVGDPDDACAGARTGDALVGAASARHRSTDRRSRRRRVPLPITPGYTSESTEVAVDLLGTPRAVLLVDGYNVSMAGWPEASIADQRQRLERLLTELAARFRDLSVLLVFDGADVGAPAGPPPRRVRAVSVRFTAPGIEADDEVIELIDAYPVDRPVLVASTDRRVRDGARHKGANVLSAAQLLAVARP
jgi:predicted RNA-binding protein with PIN domain